MKHLKDSEGWDVITPAVDAVILSIIHGEQHVWMQKRAQPEGEGLYSLPGRFINILESPEESIHSELEENNLADKIQYFEQLGVAGAPERDERKRVISVTFFGIVPTATSIKMEQIDDTAGQGEQGWVPLSLITEDNSFADHKEIIDEALNRISNKMEYSLIALNFIRDFANGFTIRDLYSAYETVWGRPLDFPNFRRKVIANSNIEEVKGIKSPSVLARSRKASQVYKVKLTVSEASTRPVLHPPILK